METVNLITKQEIKINTFGIHSCRHNTFEIIDDNFIIFPRGIYLLKYEYSKGRMINKLQISESIVHAMKRNGNYLVVASHNGDCCVMDIKAFEILVRFKFSQAYKIDQVTASDDMRYIIGISEYYVDLVTNEVHHGAVFIFKRIDDIVENDDNKNRENQKLAYKFDSLILSNDSFCEFSKIDNEGNQKFVLIERLKNDIINKGNSNNKQKHIQSNYLVKEYLITNNGTSTLLYESSLDPTTYDDYSILNSKTYKDFLILNTNKRIIKFFHLTSLRTFINLKFEGAGCLGSFEIKNDKLYVTNFTGSLLCLDLQTIIERINLDDKINNNLNPVNITITKSANIENSYLIEKINLSITKILVNEAYISQQNFSLNVNNEMNTIFWANEKGLFGVDLLEKKYLLKMKSLLKMSGCGVAINSSSKLIAVGDLEQNIIILDSFQNDLDSSVEYNEEHFVSFKFKANDAIRTVHWEENLNAIYVGTMSGKIFECDSNNMEMLELFNLGNTITCIRVFHVENLGKIEKNFLLIASTTKGYIHIFKISVSNEYSIRKEITLIKSFLAHPADPSCKDLRFGSLKFKAEIWSLTSYPNSILNFSFPSLNEKNSVHKFHLITSSEDQTIKIWEFSHSELEKDPKLLHQFKNHELAVTSVDWKPMQVLNGEVLVSCSDDRTINIYDPLKEFELVKTLKTDLIHDPHTITYISLEENGKHLAVSTINGHIVIFSLETWKSVFCEKLHLGGVEGLCWKGDMLVSCASDLNVSLINFKF